jgi:hypothetical protein
MAVSGTGKAGAASSATSDAGVIANDKGVGEGKWERSKGKKAGDLGEVQRERLL